MKLKAMQYQDLLITVVRGQVDCDPCTCVDETNCVETTHCTTDTYGRLADQDLDEHEALFEEALARIRALRASRQGGGG